MKLPNSQLIDTQQVAQKLESYSLNEAHEGGGRAKATYFRTKLGITNENKQILIDALMNAAKQDAEKIGETEFGTKYRIDFELKTPIGTSIVRSGWIVRREENFPRLVTCYIPKS
jgi:hypothetical protein